MSKAGPGRLTTHVLDTAAGCPAAGLRIDFYRVTDGAREKIATRLTNSDGRCDEPLMQGEAMRAGRYELHFHAGDYFRARGGALPDPAFLDIVPIAFGIADAGAHYHVPLLVSPWSFSTYRGS